MAHSRNNWRWMFLTGVVACLTGCQTPEEAADLIPDGLPSLAETGASSPVSASADVPLVSRNGLEVRTWLIQDSVSHFAYATGGLAEPARISEDQAARLRENGLRLFRIPIRFIDTFREDLGGTKFDRQTWHGQIHDWRELYHHALGERARAVAIDGRVRSFIGGTFGLLIRSWTLMTENGPRVHFQFAPVYERFDPGGYRRLLNPGEFTGEVFRSMAFEVALEDGFAYIVTCETPKIEWDSDALDDADDPPAFTNGVDSTPRGVTRRSVGPFGGVGPDVIAPMTFGETMLRSEVEGGDRVVLVLIPKVPAILFPGEMPDDPVNETPEIMGDAG